jgi:hypothetical protein
MILSFVSFSKVAAENRALLDEEVTSQESKLEQLAKVPKTGGTTGGKTGGVGGPADDSAATTLVEEILSTAGDGDGLLLTQVADGQAPGRASLSLLAHTGTIIPLNMSIY